LPLCPPESYKCIGIDLSIFWDIEACHFNLHLIFFTGLWLNVLALWGKNYTALLPMCAPCLWCILYAHVNVNMYFETFFSRRPLSSDFVSAREIKVLLCVGKTFYSSRHKMCAYTITSCIAMATCITPYELSGVTNNMAMICIKFYLQFSCVKENTIRSKWHKNYAALLPMCTVSPCLWQMLMWMLTHTLRQLCFSKVHSAIELWLSFC